MSLIKHRPAEVSHFSFKNILGTNLTEQTQHNIVQKKKKKQFRKI